MDNRPTLVLFAIGDGYEATFERDAPMYQQADLAALAERFYLLIFEGGNDAT